MIRTFFGIEPDAHSKLAIEGWRDKALPGLSGEVPAVNFHITLAFLGNIESAEVESLSVLRFDPFQLSLTSQEVGYFAKSGIGFLNISATSELLSLRERLLMQLPTKLRPKDKHKFVPHITLFRNLKAPMPAPILAPDFTFSFTELHLYESVQLQRKTAYKPIKTYF